MRNSPSWWQCLLAVIIGVGIGLMLSRYYQHSPSQSGVRQSAGPLQAAQTAVNDALAQVRVMPTLEDRMNILLMGVDSNGLNTPRFTNTRSDTMMLISCDPHTKRVGVVSIPRDSRVKLAGDHGIDKINAAHALGGPELSVQTVKEAFLVPVDHYVVIDVQGLRKLFQVLGPVQVVVEKHMRYTDHAGHLKVALDPGLKTLTPEQAEEYVRFRHDARGDIGRIDRQQWFMRQVVADKLHDPSVVLKLPDLFKLAKDYVVTDLSAEDMARLATFGKDIQPAQVETATLPGTAVTIHGGSYWMPDPVADAAAFNRVLGMPISVAQSADDTNAMAAPNSAIAAENESGDKPVRVIIKYPKGCEKTALAYEKALTSAGYTVKYRTRADAADCVHEQVMQTSLRADDILTERLRQRCPTLESLPVVVNLDSHAPSDFILILNFNSVAPQTVNEKDKE